MRRGAMLEQVPARQGTERHPAVRDGDGKLGEGERRAYVGRHVVRPLQRVTVEPAVLGHPAVEEGVQAVRTGALPSAGMESWVGVGAARVWAGMSSGPSSV